MVFINRNRILGAVLGEEGEQKYGGGDPKNYGVRRSLAVSAPS